jgi:hypothetical protein
MGKMTSKDKSAVSTESGEELQTHTEHQKHTSHHIGTTHHEAATHHTVISPPTETLFNSTIIILLTLAVIGMITNQYLISSVSADLGNGYFFGASSASFTSTVGGKDLSKLDVSTLKSTAHTVAAVFPLDSVQTSDDALAAMFPSGTPDYGQALGVSYDDPVTSLSTLASMYSGLKAEVQKSKPEAWQRFMNLALQPVGISCEYCCGVGPVGINKQGDSACGCQHNPALLTVALYLTAYTDYTDGEILREVMRWKTLFFPKNMIELGLTVAGKDASALKELPGMVGGC